MSLSSVSTKDALHLWSDLEKAYFGINSFGGHTAEIYAYRFVNRGPAYRKMPSFAADDAKIDTEAACALYDLLVEFKKHRECTIRIDNRPLNVWLRKIPFQHRVHVEVTPKPKNWDFQLFKKQQTQGSGVGRTL